MRDLRRLAAVLLFAWTIVHPARARAQNAAPIELKWNAIDGCPSADTVLARVRKIAGAARPTANTLRADASVTRPSEGLFRLRLEIRYGNLAAVRTIEGKSCKDLAGAAAVALALLLSSEEPLSERDLAGTSGSNTDTGTAGAIGSSANAGNQEPNEQLSTQKRPPAPSQPTTQPEARSSSSSSDGSSSEAGPQRRWHVLLMAPAGSIGIGPMKQVSRGLGFAAGLSFDRWRFLAEGTLWASQHETVSHLGDVYDVELDRFTVTPRGCYAVAGARFEFAPCALLSIHHLSVRGSGPNLVPGTDSATWPAIGVGARGRALITPWLGVVVAVNGEVELGRPEVSVSLPPVVGSDPVPVPAPVSVPVERLAPVAATLTLGTEWIF